MIEPEPISDRQEMSRCGLVVASVEEYLSDGKTYNDYGDNNAHSDSDIGEKFNEHLHVKSCNKDSRGSNCTILVCLQDGTKLEAPLPCSP